MDIVKKMHCYKRKALVLTKYPRYCFPFLEADNSLTTNVTELSMAHMCFETMRHGNSAHLEIGKKQTKHYKANDGEKHLEVGSTVTRYALFIYRHNTVKACAPSHRLAFFSVSGEHTST